jgi:hypothetical protein
MRINVKTASLVAAVVVSLGVTGVAQAATITGFSQTSGNSYYAGLTTSYTSSSFSFDTPSVGIGPSNNPLAAVFQIAASAPLVGEIFLGCAELPSNPCAINSNDNVFTPGFGSSGDIATVNNAVEWSDPVTYFGITNIAGTMAGNGGLLAEITSTPTGGTLDIYDYCSSSCGVTALEWTFVDQGPSTPEPATLPLLGLGIGVVTLLRRRAAGRV